MNDRTIKITKKIYSKYSISDIEKRFRLLGDEDFNSVLKFLNMRLATSIVIFFVILYTNDLGYILSPIIVGLYYYLLPKIILDSKIKKRKNKLENEAMFFFEVLSLSVESGNNLHNAIMITSSSIDSDLSREFQKVMEEVSYGKSLNESLTRLKERIPSNIINNIILNISESVSFGNSIVDTLNNQVDYLRDKKILKTRAQIAKMPLKISIISVIFFIPLLLLLILGPVLIKYLS